jgi:hypothetical protein
MSARMKSGDETAVVDRREAKWDAGIRRVARRDGCCSGDTQNRRASLGDGWRRSWSIDEPREGERRGTKLLKGCEMIEYI